MKTWVPLILAVALSAAGCSLPDGRDGAFDGAGAGAGVAPPLSVGGSAAADTHPSRVFWGDTHLHTKLSHDAFRFGASLGPEEAYRFARGEAVVSSTGQTAKLQRPLDFLVVADHAEGLGSYQALVDGDPQMMKSSRLRQYRAWFLNHDPAAADKIRQDNVKNGWPQEMNSPEILKTAWGQLVDAAERYNKPDEFTALIGFEWSAIPGRNHIHRVVIFRDDGVMARKVLPFSRYDSERPEDLWRYLQAYETRTGGRVLAIPHNGNFSNGLMFPFLTESGGPLSDDYLRQRARWEPVMEATQLKGDGETHPYLSPDDEFAAYDRWDYGNFYGDPKSPGMLQHEYARSALRMGLALEQSRGVNPYKFGMIGSTDAHNGLSATEESNFYGYNPDMQPRAARWSDPVSKGEEVVPGWMMGASGYAAVWARRNTREEIWDALKRKEVYATTGTRMTVRFFGGWGFGGRDAAAADLAATGYAKGVPMGGDLRRAPRGRAPTFLVAALRDPMGANLDRVQIVKGWTDTSGGTHERVYNVAWSDTGRRRLDAKGALAPVGSTVDVRNASWTNTIGARELVTTWRDADFDPAQRAFYYVRVLEIPTPRWTAYDAKRFGVALPAKVPTVHQERAYTSPIWYTP